MVSLKLQKRLASSVLKCAYPRYFLPSRLSGSTGVGEDFLRWTEHLLISSAAPPFNHPGWTDSGLSSLAGQPKSPTDSAVDTPIPTRSLTLSQP